MNSMIQTQLLKDILGNNTLFEVEEIDGKLEYKLDNNSEKIRICEINELEEDPIYQNINDVCLFIGKGKTPKYVDTSSIEVIKSGQARGNYDFDFTNKYFMDEDSIDKTDERILKYGDLVINTTGVGTVGRVTAYIIDEGLHTPDSHMCIMRTKKEVYFKYLLLNFLSIGFKKLESMAEGTGGQIELGIAKIKGIHIRIPKEKKINDEIYSSYQLQQSIAKNIEEKIEEISKLINYHQAIINLKEKVIGTILDNEFSNNINKHVVLDELIVEKSQKNINNSIELVYSVTNSKGIIPESENERIQTSSDDKSNYKIIDKFDYAFNPSRINVGSIGMLSYEEQGVVSPIYNVFSINKNIINPLYLSFYFKSNKFRKDVNRFVLNSVRPKFEFEALKKFELSFVYDEDEEFNEVIQLKKIEEINTKIVNEEKHIKLHESCIKILQMKKEKILYIG